MNILAFPLRILTGVTALFLFAVPVARAQSDDFNDGNDVGWTHYDPLGGLGAGPRLSFSFPNGQYRITSLASPNPTAAGAARGASLRQDKTYRNFCVAVDISNIGPGTTPAVGLLARIQPSPGLGTTDGYALTLQPNDNDIQISRIDDEAPTGISPAIELSPAYDPARTYRLVFWANGDFFGGAIYDVEDLITPLATTGGLDFTYTEGTAGLLIFDNSSNDDSTTGATFDNYVANDGTPPPLEIVLSEDTEVSIRWPDTALCHTLEHSSTLLTGSWLPVFFPPTTLFHVNGKFEYFLGIPVDPAGNFRLALKTTP